MSRAMNKLIVISAVALALAVAGCKDKPKEVSPAAKAEAAQLASEAEFAMKIRDFARAETLLMKSTELDPGGASYWMQLGAASKLLNKPGEAKKAYELAREVIRAEYEKDTSNPAPLFAEVEICVLLGKPDEAREVIAKAQKNHKDDRDVAMFVEGKVLDQMLADPQIKSVGL